MLLEKLTISSKSGIIRDIPFKLKGLNLIIDTTPSNENPTESGNNVGKTTFLRSIDFCFGSNGRDIYHDKETKTDNESVKSFLIENEVQFDLSLLKKDGSKALLTRSFKSENDLYINGIKCENLSDYEKKVNNLLFHINPSESKISLRHIIKKFVRSDVHSEGNIIKILHHFATDAIYEAMYLYLFGFPNQDVILLRLKLTSELALAEKQLKKAGGRSLLPKLQSRLVQLQKLIEEKESLVKNIDLPQTYDHLINELRAIKGRTIELSSMLGNINLKISLSQKTKAELVHSESHIDPLAIKQLYDEAKILLPQVQKPFEEVLMFHNKMIANKLKYVEQHLTKLDLERNKIKGELNPLLEQQSQILKSLDNTGTFDDLLKIREEVNNLYIDKGKLVGQLEKIQEILQIIAQLSIDYADVNSKFSDYIADLNTNIENVFNKYFTNFTQITHGEQLYIFYNSESRSFEFDNIAGNSGDGYKKTDIIAFDLAFISYFNELHLDFPKFVLHDKLEIIHRNQIESTFGIANSMSGQFVVSVLKERISFLGEEFINSHKIIELSENDKFFKF